MPKHQFVPRADDKLRRPRLAECQPPSLSHTVVKYLVLIPIPTPVGSKYQSRREIDGKVPNLASSAVESRAVFDRDHDHLHPPTTSTIPIGVGQCPTSIHSGLLSIHPSPTGAPRPPCRRYETGDEAPCWLLLSCRSATLSVQRR